MVKLLEKKVSYNKIINTAIIFFHVALLFVILYIELYKVDVLSFKLTVPAIILIMNSIMIMTWVVFNYASTMANGNQLNDIQQELKKLSKRGKK